MLKVSRVLGEAFILLDLHSTTHKTFFSSNSHSPLVCVRGFFPLLHNWIWLWKSSTSTRSELILFSFPMLWDSERYNASGVLIGTKLFVSSRTCIPGAMKVETVQESGKKKESLTDLR